MSRPPLRRAVALLAAFLIGFAGIVVRLTVLQVRDASAYERMALAQRLRTVDLPAQRGEILDRDRQDLALSLPAKDIYADPRYVTDPGRTAARLAPILHVPRARLLTALRGPGTFAYLARQVDLDVADRVEKLGLPGIGFLDVSKRYYPDGALAPQVLGFVGVDGVGLSGLELEYQDGLAGRSGKRTVEIDPAGHLIPDGIDHDSPPVAGENLVTTIDREIQYRAQLALAQAVHANHAKDGTVIVMDPRTGDVLAMASYPWFNPNDLSTASPDRVRNRAITDVYEPGSVNKVITASAAVQVGAVPMTERFHVPDHRRIGTVVLHDAETHPMETMTLADIISRSSNVGTSVLAEILGRDRLAQYLAKFGLGQRTGVGFPGEVDGILPPVYRWWDSSMATIPIGQGVAVTPLQMTDVYATIANGGVWVQPRLVRGVVDASGVFHPAPAPERRRVVSARTASTVTRILSFAVETGTGTAAQIPGYWVAGKTGTASKPDPNGGYYPNKYVASFIGFVPASRPAIVIAAILDEPVTVFGGVASAPLFAKIARYAIARLRIPPAAKPAVPPHALP